MSRVGFVGMGAMGARMAQRLVEAGHALTVFNRTPERCEPLVAAGARHAQSILEVADGADFVITMVRDDAASRDCWDDGGLLAALRARREAGDSAIGIECSTISRAWSEQLGEHAERQRVAFIEAPVVGTLPHAESGQLVALIGGAQPSVEQSAPLLGAFCKATPHVGALGAGATMKLVVNTLFAAQVAQLAEALRLAERGGVSRERTLDVLAGAAITSPALSVVGDLIRGDTYAPLFPVALVAKDLGYAAALAGERAQAPMVRAALAVFERAREEGLGEENIHAVAKLSLRGTRALAAET